MPLSTSGSGAVFYESVDAVVTELTAASSGTERRIIGIVGEPGAGKSTIAAELAARTGAALLPMDGYHLPQAVLVQLGRRDRMGAPDTFDVDAFVRTLAELRRGDQAVAAPSFDREREEPEPDAIDIPATAQNIIVEGNYLLLERAGWERVAGLLDATYVIDIDHDLRVRRLIDRHVRFGKSPDEARAWALGPDEANARLIAATASRADHVIRLD